MKNKIGMTLQQNSDQKHSNIVNVIAYVALGFVILVVGLFAYWSLAGSDVLEIKNEPVPVRTIRPKPKADGILFLNVDYCKKVSASGRVRTSFVGASRETFLPVYEDKQPPVCQKVEVPVPIPHDMAPGKYHLHYRVVYKINPIKEVVEEFNSSEFEVE